MIPASDLAVALSGETPPVQRLGAAEAAELAAREFGATAVLLGEVELDFSGSADAAGDVGEEGLGEFGDAVLEVLGEQVGVE